MNIEIRHFNGPTDWGWVRQYIPLLRVEDTCGLVAIDTDKNETVAAAIFDNFLNSSLQVSLILKSSMVLRHGFLDRVYNFIFEEIGKEYCYSLVAESNQASNRIVKKLGFTEKMRIPEGYLPDDDFIVYELSKEAYYKNEVSKCA